MMRIHSKLVLAALLPLALSACGGGGGGGSTTSTTPPATTATAFQDKFGTSFAADFNASSTATPPDPMSSDVPALNLTTEPIDN